LQGSLWEQGQLISILKYITYMIGTPGYFAEEVSKILNKKFW